MELNKKKPINRKSPKKSPKKLGVSLTEQGVSDVNSIKTWFSQLFKPSLRKPNKRKIKVSRDSREIDPSQLLLKSPKENQSPPTSSPTSRPNKKVVLGKPKIKGEPPKRLSRGAEREISLAESEIKASKSVAPETPTKRLQDTFRYTKPIAYDRERTGRKEVEVVEVTEDKVVKKSVILESVRDINQVSFFERIGLVNYFNALNSGKFDERASKEEYARNTKILQKENSLKYMLMEIGERNLNLAEQDEITVMVDPKLRDELEGCIQSKLLASYHFEIIKRNPILTEMNVDPVIVKMKLKKIM